MKHYSLLLFLVPMMCACTTSNLEGNVNTENQMAFCAIQNVLQQHIERISIEYIERQDVVLYTANLPTDDDKQGDDTKEMKKQDDNVATMDGIGFMVGVMADGEMGIVLGGIIGSAPGAAIGAVVDKMIAGLAIGLVMSVQTAKKQNNDSTANATEFLWNVDDWVNREDEGCVFDTIIKGGNLGYLHNWLIREMWENTDVAAVIENDELSDEWLAAYLADNIDRIPKYDIFLYDSYRFYHTILQIRNTAINVWDCPLYEAVLNTYLSTIRRLDREDKFEYTQDIMYAISESSLYDEHILALNGAISTYYYSMLLWNMDAINSVIPE